MPLAHANVATMLTGFDHPSMAGFVAQLDTVNDAADDAPGFIWRFIEDDDRAEVAKIFGSDRLLFNLSVWESVEALAEFCYAGKHLRVLQARGKWFEPAVRSGLVLWWVRSGHRPGVEEAGDRFQALWDRGPTPYAFTFATRFPPP